MALILKFISRHDQNGTAADELDRADDRIDSTLKTIIKARNDVADASNAAVDNLLRHLDILEQTFTELDEKSQVKFRHKADSIREVLRRMRTGRLKE